VLTEIRRILRRGGAAVMSVSTQRGGLNDHGDDAKGRHFTVLSGDEWARLMTDAGFTIRTRWDNADVAERAGIAWTTLVGVAE
jgi:hypothetical protein